MKKTITLTMLFLTLGAGALRAQTVQGGLFGSQNILTVRVKPSGRVMSGWNLLRSWLPRSRGPRCQLTQFGCPNSSL